MPVTLTYLFKETRHVPGVFVRDLLRLVDAVHGFAASADAAVGTFKDGGCFEALPPSAAADAFAVAASMPDHSIVGKSRSSPVQRY